MEITLEHLNEMGIFQMLKYHLTTEYLRGEGDVEKFPAICKGSFSISDDIISFENDCIWTATLDWTLILSGDWSFTLNNNLLIMTHTNGDQYILTQE